jgi:hypothetical protein
MACTAVHASVKPPSPPACSPSSITDELEERVGGVIDGGKETLLDGGHSTHATLQQQHEALQEQHRVLKERHHNELMALARGIFGPLSHLERIISLEEVYAQRRHHKCHHGLSSSVGASSSLLPDLSENVDRWRDAFRAQGFEPIAPVRGTTFDPDLHEQPKARAGSATATLAAPPSAIPSVVVACVITEGLRHRESREVVRRACVVVEPALPRDATRKRSAGAGNDLPGNLRELKHELKPSDTLAGLALRYGVSTASIARLNRLPFAAPAAAAALHLHTAVLIPRPPRELRQMRRLSIAPSSTGDAGQDGEPASSEAEAELDEVLLRDDEVDESTPIFHAGRRDGELLAKQKGVQVGAPANVSGEHGHTAKVYTAFGAAATSGGRTRSAFCSSTSTWWSSWLQHALETLVPTPTRGINPAWDGES